MFKTGWKSLRFVFIGLLVVLVLTQGAVLIAAPDQPAPAPNPLQDGVPTQFNGDVVSAPAIETVAAGEEYWTPERMASAIPMPMPEVDGPFPTGPADLSTLAAAEPQYTMPSGEGLEVAFGGGTVPMFNEWYSNPPYTSYEEFGKTKKYPLSTVGKLFFTQYGINYVCSGAVAWDNVVWTAGHCLHAGDNSSSGWSYNVKFVPAYRNGAEPYGNWKALALWTWSSWYSSGDLRYDLGAIAIKPKSGVDIGDTVGWLGFATGMGLPYHYTQYGYPAAAPFNGQVLWTVNSSTAGIDTNFAAPQPHYTGNDMTGGSSGGPWVIFQSKYGGWINGHNDYKYNNPNPPWPYAMFSPYFESAAWEVFCAAAGYEPGGC